MNEDQRPRHVDLFSGIGGFSIAFEGAGFRTVGFSEIEPYACAVLGKVWPGVRNYGDVRAFPAVACDVLTGGNSFCEMSLMKSYLSKLASDFEKADEFLAMQSGCDGLKKITGRLLPGARCAWCFNDDIEFWKSEGIVYPHPKEWPYQGFIMPFPETNGRGEMEPENVCVVVIDYPIEKENPVTDWAVLACLLEPADLHLFYIFEKVILTK